MRIHVRAVYVSGPNVPKPLLLLLRTYVGRGDSAATIVSLGQLISAQGDGLYQHALPLFIPFINYPQIPSPFLCCLARRCDSVPIDLGCRGQPHMFQVTPTRLLGRASGDDRGRIVVRC